MQRRDAILQDVDYPYGATALPHFQNNQLAPLLPSENSLREQLQGRSTPHPSPRHPSEDISTELEDIRHERQLLQQTQQRLSSDLVELRALRADMKQLVNAIQNIQHPAPPPTSKPELVSLHLPEPAGEEEEDWPAPPPWPDPVTVELPDDLPPPPPPPNNVQIMDRIPFVKKEVPTPLTHPLGGLAQIQPSASDTAPYPCPWFKPVQPPGGSRMQSPSLPPVRTSNKPEASYYGPRPTIRNFSRRDTSEFARLKLSLEDLLPPDASELFKYQVLVDHLQLEEARLIADAYLNSPTPFSDTMAVLSDKFGQPHQIALKRIAAVLDSPDIRRGDIYAFEKFALQVQSLVGVLRTLGPEGEVELQCGSHVARLLSKLPPESRAEFRRCMFHRGTQTHTLPDLSEWLKYESWCQVS